MARIDRGFAAGLRAGATSVTVGGFLLCRRFDRHPYLPTLAIPDGPPPRDAKALLAAFRGLGVPARVEFTAERHRHLAPMLAAAGLALEAETVLMTRAAPPPPSPPTDSLPIKHLAPDDPPVRLAAYLAGLASAPIALDEVEGLRRALKAGRVRAVAALEAGHPVAGAALIAAGDTAELGGVWTLPAWRGRGLAQAACRRLLGDPTPPLVWLAATGRGVSLYRRLNFAPIGRRLTYAAPP